MAKSLPAAERWEDPIVAEVRKAARSCSLRQATIWKSCAGGSTNSGSVRAVAP